MNSGLDHRGQLRPSDSLKLLAGVAILAAVLWGGETVCRGLWHADEARFTAIARSMQAHGNWLVPERAGKIYPDKPPFLFWLMNLSSVLTGGDIGRVAARLPGLLAMVASLWVTGRLAARWHGPAAAMPAAAMLATCYLFWSQGAVARIDPLFCGLQMGAIYLFVTAGDHDRPWRRRLGAWTLCGLAVLTKGPIGLLLPLLITAAISLAEGERPAWAHWRWGLPLAIAIPAAWLLLCWMGGAPASYLRGMLFGQVTERLTGAIGHHRRPFYEYAVQFPGAFLPWTLLLPAVVAAARQDRRETGRSTPYLRLAAWFGVVMVFFSLIPPKRAVYIMLAYPPAAIACAAAWARLPIADGRTGKAASAALAVVLAGAGAAFVATAVRPGPGPLPPAPLLAVPGVFFLACGTVLTYRAVTRGPSAAWLAVFVAVLTAMEAYAGAVVLPARNASRADPRIIDELRRASDPGAPLVLYRMLPDLLPLEAGRAAQAVSDPDELRRTLERYSRTAIIMTAADSAVLTDTLRASGTSHAFTWDDKPCAWWSYSPHMTTP